MSITFPAFGESGTWKLSICCVTDAVGNARQYSTADLAAAGFPTDLQSIPPRRSCSSSMGAAPANPSTLFLDAMAPSATPAKYKDSPSINFAGGNPWKDVGTWTAGPTLLSGTVGSLGDAPVGRSQE